MDVDFNPDLQMPVPISPIKFSDPIPKQVNIVPVVFIVNQVFNKIDTMQTAVMANRIAKFVAEKVKQAGKADYTELQIDCDWTTTSYVGFKSRKIIRPNNIHRRICMTKFGKIWI